MISGLWEQIEVYCDEHKEAPMILKQHMGAVFYQCPDTTMAYANGNAPTCKNDLPLRDFEKLLAYIENVFYEATLNNEVPNLQNARFKIGRFSYFVFEHKDKIKVTVWNTKIHR